MKLQTNLCWVYIRFGKSLRLDKGQPSQIVTHQRNAQDHGHCFGHLHSLAFPIGRSRSAGREKRQGQPRILTSMWEKKSRGRAERGLVRAVARWNRKKSKLLASGRLGKSMGYLVSLRRKGKRGGPCQRGATDKHCSSSLANSFLFLQPTHDINRAVGAGKWKDGSWSVRCAGMKLDMDTPSGRKGRRQPPKFFPSLALPS